MAVPCTLFDTSCERNWLVALPPGSEHSRPLAHPHPGCAGWSEKDGVLYVQPPVALLESLVAVRVLAMRPLLLHASSRARMPPSRRRVLHVRFGPADLPCGLAWHRAS